MTPCSSSSSTPRMVVNLWLRISSPSKGPISRSSVLLLPCPQNPQPARISRLSIHPIMTRSRDICKSCLESNDSMKNLTQWVSYQSRGSNQGTVRVILRTMRISYLRSRANSCYSNNSKKMRRKKLLRWMKKRTRRTKVSFMMILTLFTIWRILHVKIKMIRNQPIHRKCLYIQLL